MLLDITFSMYSPNLRMDVSGVVILHVAVVLLFIAVTPVRSYGDSITTDLEPSGSLYKTVGERLEFICSYRGVTSHNQSDSLSIGRCSDRKCVILPSEPVNSSSIQTTIGSLHLNDTGTYTCNFLPNPDAMSILFLRVGYRPSPPKDIYCFSKDHLDMNCTVTLADRDAGSELGHNVIIDYQTDSSTEWLKCVHYDAQTRSCYWKSPADSDSSGKDFFTDFSLLDRYIVRVRVRNILGTSLAIRTINDSSTIVTISKLYKFHVTTITSRSAILSWKLPEYLIPGIYMIDFAINYTSRWDRNPRQLIYSTKDRMGTTLEALVPYTVYYVAIRARGRLVTDDRNWSPVERLSFRTDKDAPSAAPRYTEGGYFLSRPGTNNTGDNCALQIYLKPIPKRRRNGDLAEMYYAVSIDGAMAYQLVTRPLTTLTLSDVSCWSDRPYTIAFRACIEDNLCSNKRTLIHIPVSDQYPDTGFPFATEVIAEGYGDNAIKISWLVDESFQTILKNVSVFWCRGNRELHICKSGLSWKILPGDATETMLNLTHSYYRDWMFAVSFTTDKDVSGGMVFDNCQFLYDTSEQDHTTGVKENSDPLFGSVKPSFNLLTRDDDVRSMDVVSFTFRYCDAQFLYRKPEQYEVFYKVTSKETEEEDCTSGADSLNVTATLSVQEVVLHDLDPMAQYSVCMRIRTSVGTSELSDVRWRKPLQLPDESSPDLALIISIALATISTAVVLTLITCYLSNKYKSMDVNVQVPDIEKYVNEDQSFMESQTQDGYAVNDGSCGSKKANATLTIRGFVKPRRPLPATSLPAVSKRTSRDSGVIHSSLESQEEGGIKDNNAKAKPDGETPLTQCELSMTNIPKTRRSHGDMRSDCLGSQHDSRDSTSSNSIIGVGSYCQWDAISTADDHLATNRPNTDSNTTENSGVSEVTDYSQIERTSDTNASRDNHSSYADETTSFLEQPVPRNEQFDCYVTEQFNPFLPMGDAAHVDTNTGTVTILRGNETRGTFDIESPRKRCVKSSAIDTSDVSDRRTLAEKMLNSAIVWNNSSNDINNIQIGDSQDKRAISEDFEDEMCNLLDEQLQTVCPTEETIAQIQHFRTLKKASREDLNTVIIDADPECCAHLETDKPITCFAADSGNSFKSLNPEVYKARACLEPKINRSVTCLEQDTNMSATCLEQEKYP